MNLRQIHDFVKMNYNQQNYDYAKQSYENIKSDYHNVKDAHQDGKNDYQLGYDQAMSDYRRIHSFRNYPQSMVGIVNKVSNNDMFEISSFIDGYNDAERNIKAAL